MRQAGPVEHEPSDTSGRFDDVYLVPSAGSQRQLTDGEGSVRLVEGDRAERILTDEGADIFAFAVVAAGASRSLSPSTIDALRRAFRQGSLDGNLVFPVETRHLWLNETHSVAVLGWWSGWDAFGSGLPWDDSDGVTCFSGRLWPRGQGWAEGVDWAPGLRLRLRQGFGRGTGLSGQFCAAHLDSRGDGRVFVDEVGMRAIYHGAGESVEVVGSSARVVAALLAGENDPARDTECAGWLAFAGVVIDYECTGFRDVRRAPPGAHVRIADGSVALVEGPTAFDLGSGHGWSVPEAVGTVADHLRAEFAVISELSGQPLAFGLTGGKDSRVALGGALLAERAGCFGTYTWGRPDLPDRMVADRLRLRYGLSEVENPHERADEARRWGADGDGSRRSAALRSVFGSSGALSLADMSGPKAPVPRVSVTGVGGEVMATNYAGTNQASTPDDLFTFLYRGMKVGGTGFLRAEVARDFVRSLDELGEQLLDEADDVREAIDRFYLRVRVSRFFGQTDEWGNNNQINPLLSGPIIEAVSAVGSEARRSEVVKYGVMAAADPELPHLPFAEDRWAATLLDHLDASRIPAELVAPQSPVTRVGRERRSGGAARVRPAIVPLDSPTGRGPKKANVSAERKAKLAAEHRELFVEFLVEDPSNPVFEVLDHAAVTFAVEHYPHVRPVYEHHLLGALTAAIWLGRHEVRPFAG